MNETGYLMLTQVDDLNAFLAEHREEMRALCADPNKANSATVAGIYIEYRPGKVDNFAHVVSISQIS